MFRTRVGVVSKLPPFQNILVCIYLFCIESRKLWKKSVFILCHTTEPTPTLFFAAAYFFGAILHINKSCFFFFFFCPWFATSSRASSAATSTSASLFVRWRRFLCSWEMRTQSQDVSSHTRREREGERGREGGSKHTASCAPRQATHTCL